MNFFTLFPYFLLIVSLAFLSMALLVFFRRRPLILNSVWMLFLMLLCFLPQIIMSFQMSYKHPSFIDILPILMFVVLIAWFVVIMKGFTIYGVDGNDFQRIFMESLNNKNYEYEQTLSSIKIKNPELELSIAIQSWIGTAQIRLKGKANHKVLNEIIKDLRNKEIKTNLMFPVFYLLIGVMITILSISMIIK